MAWADGWCLCDQSEDNGAARGVGRMAGGGKAAMGGDGREGSWGLAAG
jgi:hypothetical protein